MNGTIEQNWDDGAEVNLALGIERHDEKKIRRALHAGARSVDHVFDPKLFGASGRAEHFHSALALARKVDLPQDILGILYEHGVK